MTTPGEVLLVDTEHTYDPYWAHRLGLDADRFTLIQPKTGEEALDVITDACHETWKDAGGRVRGVYDAIILDSIGNLSFQPERDGHAGDNYVGLMARKLSNWIRPLTADLALTGTSLIGTNHITMKVGTTFGRPETMPGGKKIWYDASIILEFMTPKRDPADINQDVQAYTFRMRAMKNKTAPDKRVAEVVVRVDDYFGVDLTPEIAALARHYDIVTNAQGQHHRGGHYYYLGEPVTYATSSGPKPCGSEANLMTALDENPALRAQLEIEVREAMQAENAGAVAMPMEAEIAPALSDESDDAPANED